MDRGPLHPLVGAARRRWHATSARTLHDAALDLGGLLLKAGQFVGTRADLLPDAYVRTLSELQDHAPAHPYAVIRRVIEDELGAPPDRLFARFWHRPMASASLAQVHRAWLHDGRDVAVKVQRPEIPSSLRFDFRNLALALRTIERIEGPLGLRLLLDQLEECLPRELDFVAEARSAARMRELLRGQPSLYVPEPLFDLTTRRVVVSEYLAGIKITRRRRLEAAGIDPGAVARELARSYAEQILRLGFFHADPHPGNLLVLRAHQAPGGFRIALVDFGLVQEVPESFRAALLELLAGVFAQQTVRVAQALGSLGLRSRSRDENALRRSAEHLIGAVSRWRSGTHAQRGHRPAHELIALLRSDPFVELPAHLVLIARVIGLVAGVTRSLGQRLDLAPVVLPYLAGQS
ncbi:MAG: ABC1 kinase family protein [Myxococcota bacterium]